jgi:nitrite reductase/ring-hydroxylating ferredoxin subunit
MSTPVRIAHVAELPPGKGKVVEVAGRRLTVYNQAGRFFATSSGRAHPVEPLTETSTDCTHHGLVFDVYAEDSPATLRADELRCTVRVDEHYVWLVLDE